MKMNRNRLAVVLAAILILAAGCSVIIPKMLDIPTGERQKLRIEMNVMVPMRDGVKLATDMYMPEKPGKYPTILSRIPYGTDAKPDQYAGRYFAKNGYVVLLQDCRGIENSEGTWYPLIYEIDDGKDTTDWIKKQDWYDGNIGMIGGSYFGYTQWETALDNPDVTAMVPVFTSPNMFKMVINGGALEYIMVEGWLAGMKAQVEDSEWAPDFETGYYNAPMREGKAVDMDAIRKDPTKHSAIALIEHPGDVLNQAPGDFAPYYKTVSAPSLLIGGWFDQFLQPQLDDFVAIKKEGKGDAKKTRLIVGPWTHGMPKSDFEDKKYDGLRLFLGQQMMWLDRWLKGIKNGIEDQAPVKIFIMGENVWRDEQEWPLARTVYTDYYIHSGGNAKLWPTDGVLSTEPPTGEEPVDQFDYDPKNPRPTLGGTFQPFTGIDAGSFDQKEFFTRPDTLMFISQPLKQGVEVTGPITVTLYASSSALDTDFTAMLMDIHPDGKAMYIQDGCIRARYREGYEKGIPLVPGQVYMFKIDLWSTSNFFLPKHRIALEISSSNYPQYNRNTNGGGEGGIQNIITAHQTIYHTAQYPTHITLPVIPR